MLGLWNKTVNKLVKCGMGVQILQDVCWAFAYLSKLSFFSSLLTRVCGRPELHKYMNSARLSYRKNFTAKFVGGVE